MLRGQTYPKYCILTGFDDPIYKQLNTIITSCEYTNNTTNKYRIQTSIPLKRTIQTGLTHRHYLLLILGRLRGRGHRALALRVRLGLLLVDLMDGGGHLGGGHGGLLFLSLLLAPAVHAEHPLAEALGWGEVGGEWVVGVVEHVPVVCGV